MKKEEEKFRFTDFEEAIKLYEADQYLEGKYTKAVICDKYKTYEGDLVLDNFPPNGGIVVDGDFEVKGSIINADPGTGPFLLVFGNLKADNIIAGGSEINITGKVDIENGIFAFYNHGILDLGQTQAKYVISSNHDTRINFEGYKGVKISAYKDGDLRNSDYTKKDLGSVLVPELVDKRGDLKEGVLIGYMVNKKEIFKK